MKKSEAISQLEKDQELGIAIGRGTGIELMTRREFLDWYSDTGHERLNITERYNDEKETDEYLLIRRSAPDRRRVFGEEVFDTYEEAQNAYYEALERSHNDDNGSGGIWYPASEIDEVEGWQAEDEEAN